MSRDESEGRKRARRSTEMRVGDVMHPGVVFCVPQAPLRTVAQIMAQRRIHAVVVSDLDMPVWKHRWGVISDLDLIRAFERDVQRVTAAEIAVGEPVTVEAGESLQRAAQVMSERAVMHMIVVDGNGPRAVGVLSTLDLAAVMAESPQ